MVERQTSGASILLSLSLNFPPSTLNDGGMPWTCTTLPFQGAHCLANKSGSLVRLTFQIGLPSRSSKSEGWYPWPDSHRHYRRFELRASALGYTGRRNEKCRRLAA